MSIHLLHHRQDDFKERDITPLYEMPAGELPRCSTLICSIVKIAQTTFANPTAGPGTMRL